MTREEAIEYWEGLRKTFSSQLEKEENYFGRMHLQTTIDALDMAISALRQQERFGEVNKALTMDELRKMDGEPIYIVYGDVAWWDIVSFSIQDWIYLAREEELRYSRYGEWLAYRQKPEEVQK